jgi:hypothetical protein
MVRRALQAASVASLAALAGCSFDSPKGGASAGPDAAGAPDAPRGFDPGADCPGSYPVRLEATAAASRYRVVTSLEQFWPHNDACNADRRGSTHAVSIGSMDELVALEAHLDTVGVILRYYIGAVQDPDATAKDVGWISFDGTDLLKTAWYTNEPNDGTASPNEQRGQQLIIIDRTLPYFQDAVGTTPYGIVCECDGIAVAAKAQDFVDRDPNNPNP